MATKSTSARSRPIDQRQLPPPLLPPYPMLPYKHPYAFVPPMGYMPPVPPMGYMPPLPTWYFTPTQPPMGYMPPYAFVPPMGYMPPLPTWYFTPRQPPMGYMPPSPHNCIYTQTLDQSSSFPPPPEEDLRHNIIKQIEYYFSDDNLAKDLFLKMKMDDNGWVPITLIAGFRRVSQLTKDIQFILDSLKDSDTVEVQEDKLRRRTTWEKWLIFRSVG